MVPGGLNWSEDALMDDASQKKKEGQEELAEKQGGELPKTGG